MDAKSKKAVMIIASNNFRDEEFFKPKAILEQNGVEVIIASSSLAKARGMLGGEALPKILLQDIDIRKFDAIIFVGGTGASEYFENNIAHGIAKEAVSLNKILGAICIAPVTLAKAGVLINRKATVWESEKETLRSLNVNYTGENVTKSENIITAAGPLAAEEFANVLVEALA